MRLAEDLQGCEEGMGSESLPTSEDKPAGGCGVRPSSARGAGRGGWQSRAAIQHLPPHLWMQTPKGICLTPQTAGSKQHRAPRHKLRMTGASGQEQSLVVQDHRINKPFFLFFFFPTEECFGQTTSEGARAPGGAGEAASFPLPQLRADKPSPNRLGERGERGNKTPTHFVSVEHPLMGCLGIQGSVSCRRSRLPSIKASVCIPGRCKSPAERLPAPGSGMGGLGPPNQQVLMGQQGGLGSSRQPHKAPLTICSILEAQ